MAPEEFFLFSLIKHFDRGEKLLRFILSLTVLITITFVNYVLENTWIKINFKKI